jgi:hypothetical protein
VQANPSEADVSVEVTGVHQVESADVVRENTNADDVGVLEEDVHRVLGAGHARLQSGEA